MKKRRLKKSVKIGLFIILICIITLIIVINLNSNKNKLKKIGYNKNEISILLNYFNKKEIKEIAKKEYNSKLPKILTEKYFIPDNLNRYLNYKDEEDINKIVSIVNVNADKDWYTDIKESNINDNNKILVNKFYHLDNSFNPKDIVEISNWYAYGKNYIRKEVYENYKMMWNAAKNEGLTLLVNSGYRTFEEQKEQFDYAGDNFASRPGHSEHQTGLALDIVTYDIIGNDFENTNEFKWLQDNAHKYGFILRYPKDKEYITGYNYESWHYRYLGKELATKVKESNLTYDEYYAYYCEYKNAC